MDLLLASIFLGIVPMTLYAFVIWRIDRWEKEPFHLMAAAFLWGCIPAVILAIIAQTIFEIPIGNFSNGDAFLGELIQASIAAPVTEEITKGLGLALIFLIFRREIDSILDGLIYGSMIGFGFSAIEDVLYFSSESTGGGLLALFFLRTFLFGMLHAFFTGLTGVGFALSKFSDRPVMKILWPILGLAAAMLTHGLHNYFATMGEEHILMAVGGVSLGMLWFIATIAICLYHENRWIRIHLSEEVANGVLYAEQALETSHFWSRSSLSILSKGYRSFISRKKLLHQATELAYEKQRHLRKGSGSRPDSLARLEALRAEVKELSQNDPLIVSGKMAGSRVLPPPLPPVRRKPPPLPS